MTGWIAHDVSLKAAKLCVARYCCGTDAEKARLVVELQREIRKAIRLAGLLDARMRKRLHPVIQ